MLPAAQKSPGRNPKKRAVSAQDGLPWQQHNTIEQHTIQRDFFSTPSTPQGRLVNPAHHAKTEMLVGKVGWQQPDAPCSAT